MSVDALPACAAWRFQEVVDGFEVLFTGDGVLRGHTCAVEDGQAYAVRYEIAVDAQLEYDGSGVILDYPGIARRVA